MVISACISAFLLLSGGAPGAAPAPAPAAVVPFDPDVPYWDDWGNPGGGGGGGSCGCKDTCDIAIILDDGKGGEIRCDYSGCRIMNAGLLVKLLVCKYYNPVTKTIEERSGGKCN
jgi:hypothetical protein